MDVGLSDSPFMRFYGAHHDVFHHDRHELVNLMARHDVKYGAWTIAFEMAPLLLDAAEYAALARSAELVTRAAELFTRFVLDDPALLASYPWPPAFRALAQLDPGYPFSIPCARLDAYLIGTRVVFLELNTDGSSYMSYADEFHRLYRAVVPRRPETGLASAHCNEIVPGVLETLLHCYAAFRARHPDARLPEQPVIAIMDWPNEPTEWEFQAIARHFRAQGVDTVVVSPGTASFDGTRLSFSGTEIHLVYRRLLGADYAMRLPELDAVTAAFSARRVCMVGAPRSQIAFSKKVFALLRDPRIHERLPPDVADAVDACLPWSSVLAPMQTDFRNERIALVPFVRAHRDLFVLKPSEAKLGEGIHVGAFMDQAAWETALDAALRQDYIVQEFVALPVAYFPRFAGEVASEKRYIHLGAYVFGGKCRGMLGRTCANPLLDARHGERLAAVLTLP